MTRKILAVLFNLITLIGGHFLNSRWDRAIFLLGLLTLWGGGCYGYLVFALSDLTGPEVVYNLSIQVWQIFVYGVLVIWGLSLLLTLYDIRRQSDEVAGSLSGYFGAAVLSIVTMLLIGGAIIWGLVGTSDWESASDRSFSYYNFSEYLNFGGSTGNTGRYPIVPEGPATINGAITFNGEPVEGMTVELSLNDKYRSKKLLTGKDGRFSVSVAEGEWEVNTVQVTGWPDKPEGDFKLISGYEPRLVSLKYSEHANFRDAGLKAMASVDNQQLAMNFEIRPAIKINWPPEIAHRDREKEKNTASVRDDVIQWQPYAGAEKYVVKLFSIEGHGSSSSYHGVGDHVVTEPHLPLATLKTVPSDGEEKEYSVDVFAFDADGTLLSKADVGLGGSSFVLTDGNKLPEYSFASTFDINLSSGELKAHEENKKRIDAAKVLIDEGMLAEAEQLINKLQGPSQPGQKELAQGYLAAKQGNCELAKTLIDKARNEAGTTCVPERFKALCANK